MKKKISLHKKASNRKNSRNVFSEEGGFLRNIIGRGVRSIDDQLSVIKKSEHIDVNKDEVCKYLKMAKKFGKKLENDMLYERLISIILEYKSD